MPKNKRPNRKPGARKARKKAAEDAAQDANANNSGAIPNAKGARSVAKSYGTPNSRRSPISPSVTRGSARGG